MMPKPAPFDGYVEVVARVSSTCLVTVARNRYSVPCELAGQMVSTLNRTPFGGRHEATLSVLRSGLGLRSSQQSND